MNNRTTFSSQLKNVTKPFWGGVFLTAIYFFFILPSSTAAVTQPAPELPPPESWVDQGVILTGGSSGQWDNFVRDGFGIGSVVKKGGEYFMYYVGSSGPRYDGGPANRAVGVATSADGIHFTKYSGNPIITHQPSEGHPNQVEEGVMHPIVTLDDSGKFIMYWGALTATGSTQVKVDIHVSISSDGFNFIDQGIVIPNTIDGGGDEIWPLGVLHAQGGSAQLTGKWHVWYETDGFGGRKVSLATGNTYTNLEQQPNNPVIDFYDLTFVVWPVLHSNGKVSIFEGSGSSWSTALLKVRETTINSLDTYPSEPVMEFGDTDPKNPVIIADAEDGIWRWYHLKRGDFSDDNAHIRLRTASMSVCGDGSCNNSETCSSCPQDCGACPVHIVPVTLEAEDMPTKTTGNAVTDGWELLSNGYLEDSVNFPSSGDYRFDVVARSDYAGGAWARMEVRVDQNPIATITVDSDSWKTFSTEGFVTSGTHKVAIAFINDYYSPPEDRNLYVDKITIDKTISPPPTPKADLNNDGKVDIIDLGILLSNWGKTTKPPADLNQDGKVDVIDLGILLSNWD